MKLPKYTDVLKMSKETVSETLAPVRAARAKKQAELEMAKLDEDIATNEAKLYEECCREEVNFTNIIRMQDELGLSNRKKTQYQKILDEMFAD